MNEVTVKGLKQIPRDGLLRLKKWIEAGKPMLLNGAICEDNIMWPMAVALPCEEHQNIKNTHGTNLGAIWRRLGKDTEDFDVNPEIQYGSQYHPYDEALMKGEITEEDILEITEYLLNP